MNKKFSDGLITAAVIVIIVTCVISFAMIFLKVVNQNQPETTELTIEHLWEEENKYYFANNNDNVYMLGNYRDINDKIMYSEMPKQRFERLNKGSKYEIKYVSGLDYWISISEKEVKKNDR